jgi:protein-L-isoaspartate(D-aspartate) O-methyltransferase
MGLKNFNHIILIILSVFLITYNSFFSNALASEESSWTYSKFVNIMKKSERLPTLTEKHWNEVQKRKANATISVENYLVTRFKKASPEVLRAFNEVPREYFVYQYQQKRVIFEACYEAKAKPWQIGWGSPISDYLGQAYMTQLVRPKPSDKVLEIGTCSGFQAAMISRIAKEVYTIEINKPLGDKVLKIFEPLEYNNIQARVGDGFYGWPDIREGFDVIIVTCAARYVPPELLRQLKPGGRMVIPIGQPYKRGQSFYIYTKDKQGKVRSIRDIGCFFVPMTGKIAENDQKK